ncbi:hypothetical protein HDU91_006361 [Kappamyces sp. JEL0680]|nr:hypothetical protein HDU91_006361 [Kappamyces sp. JEL0680]
MDLYSQIDAESVRALNARDESMAQKVFKTWENRFDVADILASDSDEELIVYVPFTSLVKLKSISVLGKGGETAPSHLKVQVPAPTHARYINTQDVDFDTVRDCTPTQEWDLVRGLAADMLPEYPTKITKFSSVRNVTLYISANFGGDTTEIAYIGFKGEYTAVNRDPVITNYEVSVAGLMSQLAANPADHKTSAGADLGNGLVN